MYDELTSKNLEKRKDTIVDEETLKVIQSKSIAKKNKIVLDKDNFRIDVGLMIDRNPIFITYDDSELEHSKIRHKMMKKYKFYMPVAKELMDFREKIIPEPNIGPESLTTHMKTNPDGTFERYSAFSKHFTKTDPDTTEKTSIQYAPCARVYLLVKEKATNKWVFPSFPMDEKSTFSNMKFSVFSQFTEDKWKVYYPGPRPLTLTEREFTESEKEDAKNRKAVGVRTYWFNGSHMRGRVFVNEKYYDEFAWVSRLELSKFFEKEEYSKFVYSMFLY